MRALLAAAVLLSGCAGVPRSTEHGEIKSVWSQISTKEFVRVRGIGAVPDGTLGQTARRGASRNASLVAARYELLALVKGVKLEGGVSIGQLMVNSDVVREIANDLVRGGEEVQTEWLADDGAVTTLELRRSTVERLIQRGSPRERALDAEVKRLNRLLGVAIHNDFQGIDVDEVEAVRAKAEQVEAAQRQADDLQTRINAGQDVPMSDIVNAMNRIAVLKADDPKEDAHWAKYWRQPENKKVLDDQRKDMEETNARVERERWEGAQQASGYTVEQWCQFSKTPNCP